MNRKIILLLLIVFSITAVSAVQFDVDVDQITESSEYGIEYRENATVQEINATVLNSGSISCEYRLKAEFRYRNQTKTRYSNPYPLLPGADTMVQLYFIPENYTGQVHTTLYTHYCEQEKKISEFNFTSSEKVAPNKTIESRTTEVNQTASRVRLPLEEGRLVPRKEPAYWKTGSAEITNGTATVKYDASVFVKGENITYTVLNNRGNVVGETRVHLKASETLVDRLQNNLVLILLGISVAVNILLVIQRHRENAK